MGIFFPHFLWTCGVFLGPLVTAVEQFQIFPILIPSLKQCLSCNLVQSAPEYFCSLFDMHSFLLTGFMLIWSLHREMKSLALQTDKTRSRNWPKIVISDQNSFPVFNFQWMYLMLILSKIKPSDKILLDMLDNVTWF